MSSKARVVVVVAAAAAIVAGATVGAAYLQARGGHTGSAVRKGVPPLELPDSAALRLYDAGRRKEAEALFARSHDLADEIGAAFARWPHGTLETMKSLVASHPGDPVADLHLGLAYYWSGRDADAASSWQRTAKEQPDSPYAVVALDFLHPGVAPGLPPIVVDTAAVAPPARTLLLRGILAWDREHMVTARRLVGTAATRAPNDPAVLSAAAVVRYSPATPLAPFPKLGPLTGRYPHAAVVRFHLGELLLWTRQVAKGKAQLRLAAAGGSVYAKAAAQILRLLAKNGSK